MILDAVVRDFRYALRSLSKSRGFVAVATVCLGLALALVTTTYAILDTMLRPSLPVDDPNRLFVVNQWGHHANAPPSSFDKYDVLRQGTFYEGIAIQTSDWSVTVQAGDSVAEQRVNRVSANFFAVLGAQAHLGRAFRPGEPENVAVVSHQLWNHALGARPLDGASIWVNGQEYSVIGVLHPALRALGGDIWTPLSRSAEETGAGIPWVQPIVRLRRGMPPEAVYGQLETLAARLTATYGTGRIPFSFQLYPLAGEPREMRRLDFNMTGAAVAVLLIACANLAGLMFARGAASRRDLALRAAIGAGRPALIRQILSEAVVVAMVGGALGLLMALWAIDLLLFQMPPGVESLFAGRPQVSWRVVAFSLLATGGTVLLFGLIPAFRASAVDLSQPLKDASGTTTGRRRHRYSALLIGEVAVSLVLLMGTVLLARSTARLAARELGLDAQNVVVASIDIGRTRAEPDSMLRVSRGLLQRLENLPGARSVALVRTITPAGWSILSDVYDGSSGFVYANNAYVVSEEYLRTFSIDVIRGRDFLPGDGIRGAVIVNEVAAWELWPDGDAVGRLIKLGDAESAVPWVPVVGITRASRSEWDERRPQFYVVDDRYAARRLTLVVRLAGRDPSIALALRAAVRDALPPGAGARNFQPWRYYRVLEIEARTFLIGVFTAFSGFATLLAALGLYGLLSQAVTERLREFGIRVAVGAVPRDIVRLLLHDASVMVLAGIALGAFVALGLGYAEVLGTWAGDIHPTDAASLVIAEGVLLLAGFAACLVPALRATRADPVEILRAT